jgi:hypothetical protein
VKVQLRRLGQRWEDKLKGDVEEMEYESVECILLAWDRDIQNVPFLHGSEISCSIKVNISSNCSTLVCEGVTFSAELDHVTLCRLKFLLLSQNSRREIGAHSYKLRYLAFGITNFGLSSKVDIEGTIHSTFART